MTVKISISLTDQQAEYARKQVEEGRYPSTSAVLQQALEAQRRADEAYAAEVQQFRAVLDERAGGAFVSHETFVEMTDAMLDEEAERG